MEYLLVHRGGRGQSFVYELLYDGQGQAGEAFLMGLIDTQKITVRCKEVGGIRKQGGARSGASRRGVGGGHTLESRTVQGLNGKTVKVCRKALTRLKNGWHRILPTP